MIKIFNKLEKIILEKTIFPIFNSFSIEATSIYLLVWFKGYNISQLSFLNYQQVLVINLVLFVLKLFSDSNSSFKIRKQLYLKLTVDPPYDFWFAKENRKLLDDIYEIPDLILDEMNQFFSDKLEKQAILNNLNKVINYEKKLTFIGGAIEIETIKNIIIQTQSNPYSWGVKITYLLELHDQRIYRISRDSIIKPANYYQEYSHYKDFSWNCLLDIYYIVCNGYYMWYHNNLVQQWARLNGFPKKQP